MWRFQTGSTERARGPWWEIVPSRCWRLQQSRGELKYHHFTIRSIGLHDGLIAPSEKRGLVSKAPPLFDRVHTKGDPLSGVTSQQRTFPRLAGPDPRHGAEIRHDDLPVPDAAGLRTARNGFDHARDQLIRNEHFDLRLGHKVGRILSASIDFPMPLLASESFDFRDRHPLHTDFHQRILDL